ncbi:MAG: histidinol-phosphate transaminase [Zetaproteobacteria bacterium]|nr:MAG: histidinol-phosphate transaminase [Zetaproteobacteria bacterium]
MTVAVDWAARAVAQSARLHPYVPGKPVEQLLRELGVADGCKLASNENPFGPPPAAVAAIQRAAEGVHRYPDGDATELKQALAARHGVDPAQILLGNGSNEVIELIIRTFAGPGDGVLYSAHGFIVYALAARAAGAAGRAVAEPDGLHHDLDATASAVDARSKVVCIANPNNPTGTMHELDALQRFLDRLPPDLVVLLDEAYVDFVTDDPNATLRRLRHPGLVVCRTFSKAFGLAGLRIGYAIADAGLLEVVNRFREPFNVNALAQQAALAALEESAWVRRQVAAVVAERRRLERELAAMGLLQGRTHGNFVLIHHRQAARLVADLERRGLILRPLSPYGMAQSVRVTVGRPEENDRLLGALRDWLERA